MIVTLSPYDPQWPTLFNLERDKLLSLLKDSKIKIEHIGSTAIPGIIAKPVIDILIGVENLSLESQKLIPLIESLGYRNVPEFKAEFPHREYFQKNNVEGQRTHQIHLVNLPSAAWKKLILFRDYLIAHPTDAKHYENLKIALAKKFPESIPYALGKNTFCQELFQKAFLDFYVHTPDAETQRLIGFIPQVECFDLYKSMFQDPEFVQCFGIELNDAHLQKILNRDTVYWNQYGFGPYVWFDKRTHEFIGEGGLNHAIADKQEEIELTYSLSKNHWGKGYAVEIGKFAIDQAFNQLNLDNFVCFTSESNHQSLRVMEKLRFKYEKSFFYANIPHKLHRIKR